MATIVHKCVKCAPHKFQDKMYGESNRVHNTLKDTKKARCTVCCTVVELVSASPKTALAVEPAKVATKTNKKSKK